MGKEESRDIMPLQANLQKKRGPGVSKVIIRPICVSDDAKIAEIIRKNLEAFHLNIPGTAYFDPELACLSKFYKAAPEKRAYFVAECAGFDHCAELQKLYLSDAAKGKGLGKQLMQTAEEFARAAGYRLLYLETHTNLKAAICLYEKLGFRQIEKPAGVFHETMNRFYIKQL